MDIAVCDDNMKELRMLSSLLSAYRSKKQMDFQVHAFPNGFSLLDAVEQGESFDLVILDILMPGQSGMDTARELRKKHAGIEIIFLTSSPEYAVESYEVRANDYLLKPILEERLFQALDRCLGSISHKKTSGFVIHGGANQYTRILYSNLVYGEAMRKSVNLYLSDRSVISSNITFTELTRLLDANPDFLKPHRSYIVNMHYIENITKTEIVLMNGNRIPIPRNNYPEVAKLFFDFAFQNSFR